ncbi:TetR/AcrR family transcriptional regulator [Oerskovia sp. Sa1BUA8]|uniref:TetR/AcrR family transcriptional regulator n=1 Tax=Oerskovia douganii TaxID=2762210 RepID=A0A9D5UBR8_9CELL|nr:TetR/AcrR family transcriptional regulator [Oerskovia douganii]MBE7702000.1 TetR/AcrR family transcriptional regulator [Oerskovia douganii]
MSEPVLRADARRNRDQIVAAATSLFVDVGPDVALETVAREAGVGIATLYRRFPDREALLHAVLGDALGGLLADMRSARDREPTAWGALVGALGWSHRLRVVLALTATVTPQESEGLQHDVWLGGVRDELVGLVDALVTAAQHEGSLRADVATGDVILLMAAVSRGLPQGTDSAANAYARAHALVLDALRAPAVTRLPGVPTLVGDLPL